MRRLLQAITAPAGALALISVVFMLLRYIEATTATLAETYYDEAVTGLMSLDILRGIHHVFYWGQPYLGAADAYIAAAAFWLFGASTLVLRMAAAAMALLWAWSAWSVARRVAGADAGLLAGLYVAVPPIFLSYIQLSSHGETYAVTWGAVVIGAAACLVDPTARPTVRRLAWLALGVAGGLGWWETQMMGMFLLAAAVVIVVAQPRVLLSAGPWVALGLFFVASLPFWVWNWRHEWATFRHIASWGAPLPPLASRPAPVVNAFLATLEGFYWDGRAVTLPPAGRWLDWLLVATVYVAAVALAAGHALGWLAGLLRRERPWREPLDVVVLAFWATVAAHLATWFGTSGILRYSMTFYATIPILVAVALTRLTRRLPGGPIIAAGLAAGLLVYNGLTNVLFIREAAGEPYRPVDAVIARLHALGIRGCYGDSRVAQVIAFESLERIPCADFVGYRNFALLQAVDAIDQADAVAIVAHWRLQSPSPELVAATLRLMGAEAAQDRVGEYVIFHHVRPPDPRVRPIPPARWSVRASTHPAEAEATFDRRVWTRWTAPKQSGQWLELDLGASYRLVQLTLEAGPFWSDGPDGLRVETSPDGRTWDVAAQTGGLLTGMHWWKGHPRIDESGRVIVRLAPRSVRYVRIVQTGVGPPGNLWSVSELFAYEAADEPWSPSPAAVAAVAAAADELAHWMDDPFGPHPRRAPVTYEHRRAQVRWAPAFTAADRALTLAPEWDEAHHRYAEALARSGWSEELDIALERARADGSWREVIRWAELADARLPFWRSGRAELRAEALERLGRPADAVAARREAVQDEARRALPHPVHARFADVIELTGVEVPGRARRGDGVSLRYGWRVLQPLPADYTAFVHLQGPGRVLNQDHQLGGDFGTSRWVVGERAQETLELTLPPDIPLGVYRVKVGVWQPERRRRLRLTATDHPREGDGVVVASFVVTD
jgi:hypothetical protein